MRLGNGGTVVGLDIGTTMTRAVVAESRPAADVSGDEPLRVLGVGEAPGGGLKRGVVTHLEATVESVRDAVGEAEAMAGREVETAYVGLAPVHAEVGRSRGVVAVSGAEVDGSHLARVDEVGRAVPVAPDRELLHALCQEYCVDGRDGVEDPVGMMATRLESEVCIVTAASDACRDLRRVVDRAGYRAEELVLEPLATGLAVLRDGERDAGVALVNVGGAGTSLAVFRGRKLLHIASQGWGGDAVTRDIAKGLGISETEALRLKERHGTARRAAVDVTEKLQVSGPSVGSGRSVERELLAHIIEQRMDEVFGLVYEELEDRRLLDGLGGGVVLTGGGVALPETVELARSVFNTPVRLGEPGVELAGATEVAARPWFSTAVGLARYGSLRERGGALAGAGRVLTRVGEWLKEFF